MPPTAGGQVHTWNAGLARGEAASAAGDVTGPLTDQALTRHQDAPYAVVAALHERRGPTFVER